jgi:hypothetical protein
LRRFFQKAATFFAGQRRRQQMLAERGKAL